MLRDFTVEKYNCLLKVLLSQGFLFQSLEEFLLAPKNKVVILRHDVDKLPENSLKIARLENSLNIKASYYFRIVKESNNVDVLKEIIALGHEIGYHYEDFAKSKGDIEKSWEMFKKNLEYFKQYYPVTTICMHGSPLSKYDSRDLWGKYDYKKLDIIGEPYFDIDFSEVLYLTDTGRRWDGDKVSVRDKPLINNKLQINNLKTTNDLIEVVKKGGLPNKVMITTHPQRWTNNFFQWSKELVKQYLKNIVKQHFFVKK